jgi:hypothetical protein
MKITAIINLASAGNNNYVREGLASEASNEKDYCIYFGDYVNNNVILF